MEILGLVDVPVWLISLTLLLVTLYNYVTWTFGAFSGSVLKGPKPIPLLGNNYGLFKNGMIEHYKELFKEYGTTFAYFDGSRPMVLTMDPEIIKTVTAKAFHNFLDNNSDLFTTGTKHSRLMLICLKGEQWKRIRGLISPSFTTGKLKAMTHQIHECCTNLIESIGKLAEDGKPVVVKNCAQAFTAEAIARTAFSLKLNAHENADDPFVVMTNKPFDFSVFNPAMLAFFFPTLKPLCRFMEWDIVTKDVATFYGDLTDQIIEERRQNNVRQTDFLQLMLNAHEEEHVENDNADEAEKRILGPKTKQAMSREELKAQAIIFFLAGFDTTASTLAYFWYNLCVYPDAQEKLYNEVMLHCEGKDEIDYETLRNMTYLDYFVKETQRLYPVTVRSDRVAENDITIKGIDIKKGWVVSYPVYLLHTNPAVWPDSMEFKPERFAELTKEQTESYFPFGNGPRNCVGSRLALLELKMAAAVVIKNFRLVKCDETQIPMILHKTQIMQPETSIKIVFQKRT